MRSAWIGGIAAAALSVVGTAPGRAAELDEIRQRGAIRLLVTRGDDHALLARRGWTPDQDRRLAESFARDLGVEVDWVWVEDEADLIPALLEGRADLVADGLAITEERRSEVAFSAPSSPDFTGCI